MKINHRFKNQFCDGASQMAGGQISSQDKREGIHEGDHNLRTASPKMGASDRVNDRPEKTGKGGVIRRKWRVDRFLEGNTR